MKNIHELFPVKPVRSDDPDYLRQWRGRTWGLNNDVGQIRTVLMKRPGQEVTNLINTDVCKFEDEYGAWVNKDLRGYWISPDRAMPDMDKMQAQHDSFAQILREEGAEVIYVDEGLDIDHDFRGMTNVRDVMFSVPGGAVICRMAPAFRFGEEQWVQKKLAELNMPIAGTIIGEGVFEGGSFGFLSPTVAYAGHSKRGNWEALRQIESTLQSLGIELVIIPLVGHSLHTDSAFTMADVDKALYIPGRLPWWFLEKMEDLGIQGIEVDPKERWAVNSLTVSPGKVIVPAEAEVSIERMVKAGLEVVPLEYDEVQKNGGGLHCTTNPLVRDSVH
ncbi:amidinotransferase [Nesterenkonia salmonea]|uniref:Amidinotransferase n=1 Tax=Nesterenkonia salmonea TaxID=1804987 RepID=A0A5R9BLN3_9MICC|nr:arginine deiminase family protein [Nesterenkonia salmonea]TLQ01060.1 amidinotransferase [Nesterenkonia salmonea]